MIRIFNHTANPTFLPGRLGWRVSLLILLTFLVGCGSDDKVDYDRDFTQVSYAVSPALDLQQLYTIRATYTDFKGFQHTETIENTTTWTYKEKESGDHPISLRVTATAKRPEEYGSLSKSVYAFTWEYAIHWYKQQGGAHSEQPSSQGRAVSRTEVETYMAENPVITLISFSRP